MKAKKPFRFALAAVCLAGLILSPFYLATVNAQSKLGTRIDEGTGGPNVTATLTDSFADTNMDGRAGAGEEITYTATIINNGTTDATDVVYNTTVDTNSTLVAGSAQAWADLNPYVIRCPFRRITGFTGGCNPRLPYLATLSSNYNVIGGDQSLVTVFSHNLFFNTSTQVLSFDAQMHNRTSQKFGTLDGTNLDPVGVLLFIQALTVTSGTGTVTAIDTEGTGTFTAPGQAFYQYGLLDPDETRSKTLQYQIPLTVDEFQVDFMVYTRPQVKIVINEVLVNPGGTITDASGEWFELVNLGDFPVELQGFKIGDSSATTGDRPLHTIASSLVFQPHTYRVFGNVFNTTSNGGVPVDYAYSGALALANTSADAVRLVSPTDFELDRVNYSNTAISAQNGITRELRDPTLDNANMDGVNWQDASASTVYGPGGRGTPRATNTGAPAPRPGTAMITPESGESISTSLGTISPGGTAVVTYRVTVADPIPVGALTLSTQGTVSGSNFATVPTDDPAVGGAGDLTVTPIGLAPSAATASISGRVVTSAGRAIANAVLTMADQDGNRKTAITNPFGYYSFADIDTGQTYVISTRHRTYHFQAVVVTVGDDVTGLNIVAVE